MRKTKKHLWGKEKAERDEKIYHEWLAGAEIIDLLVKYRLSYQWIWRIIREKELNRVGQ